MIYNFNVWGKIFKNVHTADDAYSSGVLQIVSGWCNQPAAARNCAESINKYHEYTNITQI